MIFGIEVSAFDHPVRRRLTAISDEKWPRTSYVRFTGCASSRNLQDIGPRARASIRTGMVTLSILCSQLGSTCSVVASEIECGDKDKGHSSI
jgi:hypothetical protein